MVKWGLYKSQLCRFYHFTNDQYDRMCFEEFIGHLVNKKRIEATESGKLDHAARAEEMMAEQEELALRREFIEGLGG